MSRNLRSRTSAAVAAAAMGLALIAIGPPAYAGGDRGGGGHDDDVVTVATGLNNPRQLSVERGDRLYIAEAGTADSCEAIPDVPPELRVCGLTGSVTEVRRGEQRRVVTDLPALDFLGEVVGASDVDVRGNRITVLVGGMAAAAAARDSLGDEYATFGTLRTGRLHWAPLTGADLRLVADVNAFEVAKNPDGNKPPDSNAVGFVARGDNRYAIADAGGNTLLRVGRQGLSTVAVFPNGDPVPGPDPTAPEISPQAVPTDVTIGPDGAYYVSQLTGFPFPTGGSTIWRVTRDGEMTAYATGLTMVTSLAWRGDTLYAVQLDDEDYIGSEPSGSLREVTPGGSEHEVVVDDLSAPYGVAIRGHSAYVTVNSTSTGDGSVIRVDLH
ncbi:MAG: ScyD/ScyE family protein [Agrococcus sp.]